MALYKYRLTRMNQCHSLPIFVDIIQVFPVTTVHGIFLQSHIRQSFLQSHSSFHCQGPDLQNILGKIPCLA